MRDVKQIKVTKKKMPKAKVTKKRGAQARRSGTGQAKKLTINLAPYLRVVTVLGLTGIAMASVFSMALALGNVSVERVSFAGGIKHVSQAQLVSRVNPFIEGGYFGLDLDAIKASVEEEPWVLSASVQREWPWSIRVAIEEQAPIAYWGRNALLNHRGEVFTPSALPKGLGLPTLEGPDAASAGVLQAYQLMTQLLADTPIQLSHLMLDEGGQWSGVTSDGVQIKLGRKRPVQNMKRFLLVYREKLESRFADVQQVDTRYINGIAVDWREGRS